MKKKARVENGSYEIENTYEVLVFWVQFKIRICLIFFH